MINILLVDDDIVDRDPTKSSVTASLTRRTTLTWDGSFNFKKTIEDHTISAQATMALDQRTSEQFTATKQGVANNNIQVLNGANINPDAFSGFNYTTVNDIILWLTFTPLNWAVFLYGYYLIETYILKD